MEDLNGFLPQGIDYLGFLDAKLRDLRGYTTLAYEFLQNADDAKASEVIFDFTADALLVHNNEVFSDCDRVREAECPWKVEFGRGYRCDFHRFRLVAGRDKRGDSDSIGAFGIGFISVYQITDRPELFSGKRHWTIRPEEPQESRIEQGLNTTVGNTTFRLPWAFQQNSLLRKALNQEAVNEAKIQQFRLELVDALPYAILFLRHVRSVEVRLEGRSIQRVELSYEIDRVILHSGERDHVWQVFAGSFEAEANQIKKNSGDRIEAKRKSEVTIAIPGAGVDCVGVLYAYLPTEHRTGLPLNINSDFFPSSDRKRVLLDGEDYQQRWNEVAIEAGARVFAQNCIAVRDFLGHKAFWKALQGLEDVARNADRLEHRAPFAQFWEILKEKLGRLEVVKTSAQAWKRPGEAFLLRGKEEEDALPVFESIGMHIVHPDLRFAQNLLTESEVGVSILRLSDLAMALWRSGLTQRVQLELAPVWIRSAGNRERLGHEIEALCEQKVAPIDRQVALQKIRECSIAVSEKGDLASPSLLRSASSSTVAVFQPFGVSSHFLGVDNPRGIVGLVAEFTTEDAVRILETISVESLLELWKAKPASFKTLIEWFSDNRGSMRGNQALRARLRNLMIWPAGGTVHALTDLTVPGNFDDPLHLAKIVDLEFLGNRRDFLIELDARELTFPTYAVTQVPRALSGEGQISAEVRRAVLRQLATRMGDLTDLPGSREKLAASPIAECNDGIFRAPAEVYFDSTDVVGLLGKDAPLAVLSGEHETAVRQLLRWLGVTERPRPGDLLRRIRSIVESAGDGERRASIQRIFIYLGKLWSREEQQDEIAFAELKTLAWLPMVGDARGWHYPSSLYASYSRHLFETQGHFLDVSPRDQALAREFIGYLGIGIDPSPGQVVNHLLECSNRKTEVNSAVYDFLSQKASDPAILRLRDKACLLLDVKGFLKPDQVFWGPHRFGRFRVQLSADHGPYRRLYDRLGVRELPDAEDALRVLLEVSDEYGKGNRPLDEEGFDVVMHCWTLIEDFLSKGSINGSKLQSLANKKVVADDRRVLERPDQVFFDDRPGLAAKFQSLIQHNVVVRPLGVWHAMEAAGVRPLSKAVQSSLVECDGAVEATEMRARLKDRQQLIARVIEAQRIDASGQRLELLDRLSTQEASRLQVTYTLRAFNQVRTTEPEEAVVYLDSNTATLYFRSNPEPPWAAIARELSFAMLPDWEPGSISSGLKEVLSAGSFDEASRILDELGYPGLQVGSTEGVGSVPVGVGAVPEPMTEQGGEPGIENVSLEAGISTTHDALRALGIGTSPEPLPASLDQPESVSAGSGRSPRPSSGSQLRTYVAPERANGASRMDEDAKNRRTSLATAGVERVLEYERAAGRNPTEMPANYPGYDLESQNQDGFIVRFIEVKAVAGEWNLRGVGLTREQFDRAAELGDRYWLYVVEKAEEENGRIFRIRDPARSVNQFFYDDGWTSLAEEDGWVPPAIR